MASNIMHFISSQQLDPNPDRDGTHPGRQVDPLRRFTQSALVIYLAPVILLMLMIGGILLVFSSLLTAASKGIRWFSGGPDLAAAWGGANRDGVPQAGVRPVSGRS